MVVLAVAGCGSGSPDAPPAAEPGDSGRYASEVLARTDALAQKIVYFRTYAEAMPNRKVKHHYGTGSTSDSVVRGRIVGIEKGRGWTVDDNGENTTELSFDDSSAAWKSFHLRVAVDEQLGGERVGPEVLAGLTFIPGNVDFERLGASLKSLGEVVVPVTPVRGDGTFAYDSRIVAVADGGDLLAQVGSDGKLTLPLAEAGSAARLLEDTPTLSRLRQELAKPSTVTVWRDTLRP